jgi:3-dehydroquinate synthase
MSRGSGGPSVIWVRHAAGRYPVLIEPGLFRRVLATVHRRLPEHRLAVITDTTVRRLLPIRGPVPSFTVRPGERSKDRAHWARLSDQLLAAGFGRDSALIAAGGGVVGDLAGFVAATYNRGIPVVQVPTTLLAMVDASVGGKTGVNTVEGKNLIGAFHPPAAVLVDPLVVRTLPPVHYRGGLAEAVKHAAIADARYFRWIERHAGALRSREPAAVAELVRWSVRIKAKVVSSDERESDRRAILNAGHTLGHALEAGTGYRLAHGDAVGIGLVLETRLGERAGYTAPGTADRIAGLLEALGIPTAPPASLSPARAERALARDKKAVAGAVRYALPAALGRPARDRGGWTVPLPARAAREALGILQHPAR